MTNSEQTRLAQDLMELNAADPKEQLRLKECLIDFLASVLVGAQTEIGRQVTREHITDGTSGFAFTLAYLAELSEYSHGHHWGAAHTGSVVLPATLALAANEEYVNGDFSSATIAGYEAMSRFGEAIMPELKRKWGSNATGFCASVGAAAVAARIYGLTKDQTSTALGTAAYLTPHSPQDGYVTGVHGFETGAGVSQGIASAKISKQMSSTRTNGATDILDVYHKQLKGVTAPESFKSVKNSGLAIHELYFKPYPSCRVTHPVIEGIEELLEQGLNQEDVERITILTPSGSAKLTAELPSVEKLGYVERQFSMQYLTAASLEGRKILDVVFSATEEEDKRWLNFAREKVSVASLDDLTINGERRSAIIVAWLKDGSYRKTEILHPLGGNKNSMSLDRISNKFKEVALQSVGQNYDIWEKEAIELNWPKLAQQVHKYLVEI